MSTPDGTWEDSNEVVTGGAIAVDQYEVSAGIAMVAGGAMPAVMVRVSGVLSEDVGDPDAARVQASFILRTEDVERFAAQLVAASKMRPTS